MASVDVDDFVHSGICSEAGPSSSNLASTASASRRRAGPFRPGWSGPPRSVGLRGRRDGPVDILSVIVDDVGKVLLGRRVHHRDPAVRVGRQEVATNKHLVANVGHATNRALA